MSAFAKPSALTLDDFNFDSDDDKDDDKAHSQLIADIDDLTKPDE